MVKLWKYVIALLALIAAMALLALLQTPDEKLHLIACDVGQGDAILAVYGKTQILIDGGPGREVLDCLSENIPFNDRSIEAIILTHPQKDHYGGLIAVLNAYDVGAFISTPLDSGSQDYQVLKSMVGGRGIWIINPEKGMSIRLGLIYLDILHPPQEAFLASENSMLAPARGVPAGQASDENEITLGNFTSSKDPNDFSVVAVLRFNEFDALLTGDIGPEISDKIAESLVVSGSRTIEYIKIPHHGSKNGLSEGLLDTANPQLAVISSGKGNRYGHPHQEIIKMLSDRNIKIYRTDEMGEIEIMTDGQKIWLETQSEF